MRSMPPCPAFSSARANGYARSTRQAGPNQRIAGPIGTSDANWPQRLRAEDDEYSVIPNSFFAVLWPVWCCATWLERVFFDGALAEAPASARPAARMTSAAARMTSFPMVRYLSMVSSVWFQATNRIDR